MASTSQEGKIDVLVKRGDRIGMMGKTGADECHLHLGLKLKGIEIPSWPLLEQNMEADMLKGDACRRIVNRRTKTTGNGTRLRPSPGTAGEPLAEFARESSLCPSSWSRAGWQWLEALVRRLGTHGARHRVRVRLGNGGWPAETHREGGRLTVKVPVANRQRWDRAHQRPLARLQR